MLFVLILIFALLLIFGPHLWIRHVMKKHGKPDNAIPGTGGELAQHLVERFGLTDVVVEPTSEGDHYSPHDKAVRLSPEVFKVRSLTAVAVAAHEVGHAIQYHRGETITGLRHRFTPAALMIQKVAIGFLMAMPLMVAIFRVPHAALLTGLIGVLAMLAAVFVQLIVLPMEWDASFNKALPILAKGDYIQQHQYGAVNSILKAAAFTYVAAALMDMLRLGRWLVILRSAIR